MKRPRLILLVIVLLAIAAAAYGWWWMAFGRWPLAGDLRHDFGDIAIVGASGVGRHTFHLRNRTDETIHIQRISASCGCTDVLASTMEIAPGETIDLDVTLRLTHPGRKKAQITLLLGDESTQTLWIEGVGQMEMKFWAAQRRIQLTPGEETPLLFMVDLMETDEQPSAPAIEAPEGVTVRFDRWDQVYERDEDEDRAARWRGHLAIALEGEPVEPGSKIRITIGDAEPAVVTIDAPSIARDEMEAAPPPGEAPEPGDEDDS